MVMSDCCSTILVQKEIFQKLLNGLPWMCVQTSWCPEDFRDPLTFPLVSCHQEANMRGFGFHNYWMFFVIDIHVPPR